MMSTGARDVDENGRKKNGIVNNNGEIDIANELEIDSINIGNDFNVNPRSNINGSYSKGNSAAGTLSRAGSKSLRLPSRKHSVLRIRRYDSTTRLRIVSEMESSPE